MKVLLDENLPQKLRVELLGHDIFTVRYMGWTGIENGKLLRLAADANFDVLISTDRGLQYQQDVNRLPIAVIVLRVKPNTIEAIRPFYDEILRTLEALVPKSLVKIPQTA